MHRTARTWEAQAENIIFLRTSDNRQKLVMIVLAVRNHPAISKAQIKHADNYCQRVVGQLL
jgi:hypothetical protein